MKYTYYSNTGGRKQNEDFVALLSEKNGFCALVADGLGGQGNGEVAAQSAVNAVCEAFRANPSDSPDQIRSYFTRANNTVLAINGGKHHTMTTLVGFFCTPHGMTYAHVGDSRLYHFYNGKLLERTIDHSVPQIAVALGEITEAQIRSHPDRNRILRAIGADRVLETEVHMVDVTKGFHSFLLCSDGFWEYVLEDEMEIDLAKADNPSQWLDLMLQRRVERAPDDADNHSAILLFFDIA